MKPATVAPMPMPMPMPRLDATCPSANEAARCSGVTRVMSSVWLATRAAPIPAPPTAAQANACHGWSTKAKPELERWFLLTEFDEPDVLGLAT
jgi:hypothetical protein